MHKQIPSIELLHSVGTQCRYTNNLCWNISCTGNCNMYAACALNVWIKTHILTCSYDCVYIISSVFVVSTCAIWCLFIIDTLKRRYHYNVIFSGMHHMGKTNSHLHKRSHLAKHTLTWCIGYVRKVSRTLFSHDGFSSNLLRRWLNSGFCLYSASTWRL